MNKELISIITPIFNCECTIEKCLNSLRNQKYTNIEVIMVNDGSTDRSFEICSNYLNYDSRFKLINQKNQDTIALYYSMYSYEYKKGKYD